MVSHARGLPCRHGCRAVFYTGADDSLDALRFAAGLRDRHELEEHGAVFVHDPHSGIVQRRFGHGR